MASGIATKNSDVTTVKHGFDTVCREIATIKASLRNSGDTSSSAAGDIVIDWEAAASRLEELASLYQPSSALFAMRDKFAERLEDTLRRRYYIAALNRDWPLLPDGKKEGITHSLVVTACGILSDISGFTVPHPRIEYFEEKGSKDCGPDVGLLRYEYQNDPGSYMLRINTHADAIQWQNFPELLNTVAHECGHHGDAAHENALFRRILPDDSPLRTDAARMQAIDDHGAYIPFSFSRAGYKNQFKEAGLRGLGERLQKFAMSYGPEPQHPAQQLLSLVALTLAIARDPFPAPTSADRSSRRETIAP